jgi:hypothetical protein
VVHQIELVPFENGSSKRIRTLWKWFMKKDQYILDVVHEIELVPLKMVHQKGSVPIGNGSSKRIST